jgi:glycosyltransferase involved in cell wall biosynthesis
MEKYVTIERNPDRGELLILGRVADSKRIDLALRALAQLKDEGWHLTIAGSAEPETLDRLRALARQLSLLDRVDFATEISEPTKNALLARAQMALFPSQGEGFGLALLEVVASGVPALAQDIPAHRALLGPEHLTDFRDSAKAARRLRTLLGQPAFQPARYPTTRHARRYDLSRLVGEIEEVYASLGLEIAGRAQQVLR